MKYSQMLLLLAGMFLGEGRKELVVPPSEETRQASLIVESPATPKIDVWMNYYITVKSQNFPPKRFSELGQVSDTYLVLATDKDNVEIKKAGIKVEEWDRKEGKFMPIKEDSKERRKIIRGLIGGVIEKIPGLELEDDSKNRKRRVTETSSLLDYKFEDQTRFLHPYIIIDTEVGQDNPRDALRVTVPLKFSGNITKIPLAINTDIRNVGFGSTAETETIELYLEDIVGLEGEQNKEGIKNLLNEMVDNAVFIPPGKYKILSYGGINGIHEVVLERGLYVSKYELTQELYKGLMNENPSIFKGVSRPVENISAKQGEEWCRKASKITGRKIRVPNESEWQVACGNLTIVDANKGTETLINNFGEYAWNRINSDKQTHDIGTKKSNNFGIHDMFGNVGEWCFIDLPLHLPGFTHTPKGENYKCINPSTLSRIYSGGDNDLSSEVYVGLRPVIEP